MTEDVSWEFKDDPERPGYVQLIVNGKLTYIVPKEPLRWPKEETDN